MKRSFCVTVLVMILLCVIMSTSIAATKKWELEANSKIGETYRIGVLDVTLKKISLEKIDGIYNVVLEIDFKNNSNREVYFESIVLVNAFQGNIWLEENYNDETAINKMAKAAPGKTETYSITFMVDDPNESIKINLDAWDDYTEKDKNDFEDRVFSLSLKNANIKADEVYNEEEALAQTLALMKVEKPIPKDVKHGELLDVKVNKLDDIIVVKVKIKPSWTNSLTILQNFINVEYLVSEYNVNEYSELQYWAVADMTDGSESKVISFDVPHLLLEQIKKGEIPTNMIQDYVSNLWILPSLRE